MDFIILIGIIIAAIGIILIVTTSKWSWVTGAYTKSSNKPITFLGFVILAIGLAIVILKAKANGQLG